MRGTARALAAVTAVLTLGLTTACAAGGGEGAAGPKPVKPVEQALQKDGKPVTLKYWTSFPPEATLREAVAAFERATPGIKVELREFEAADYVKRLPKALDEGEELDVVDAQTSAMTNMVRDRLLPVADWEDNLPEGWRDELDETVVGLAEKSAEDGKLYSVPMGSSGGAIMYYNAALLSELGMSSPETAADLESIVMRVKKELPDLQPIVFSGEPRFQEEMLFTIAGQAHPTLSDDLLAGRKKWNDSEVVSALTAYKSLFDRGVLAKSTLNVKGDRPAELFGSGKALFLVDGSRRSSMLSDSYRRDNEIALTDIGAGAFPVVLPGGKPAARVRAEGSLSIPKASKHVAEAAELIEFLTMGDGVAKWSRELTLVPSLQGFQVDPSVFTTDAAKDGYTAVQEIIGAGGSTRIPNEAFLDKTEGETILDVAHGRISPEKAAARLQEEWQRGQYGTR